MRLTFGALTFSVLLKEVSIVVIGCLKFLSSEFLHYVFKYFIWTVIKYFWLKLQIDNSIFLISNIKCFKGVLILNLLFFLNGHRWIMSSLSLLLWKIFSNKFARSSIVGIFWSKNNIWNWKLTRCNYFWWNILICQKFERGSILLLLLFNDR